MAREQRIFNDIPLGAVFEAAQKSIRLLKFNIIEETIMAGRIVAKSPWSIAGEGQLTSFSFSEIDNATYLIITTNSGHLFDWGEGRKIINGILDNIEIELKKIEESGRIARQPAKVHAFSEISVANIPREADRQSATIMLTGGNNLKHFLTFAVFVFAYLSNPSTQEFGRFLQGNLRSADQNIANAIISSVTSEILVSTVVTATTHKNFFFWSTYEVDTAVLRMFAPELPERIVFLGVFGQFFRM